MSVGSRHGRSPSTKRAGSKLSHIPTTAPAPADLGLENALRCALCGGERGRQLAGSLVRARDLVVRAPERGRQPRGQPRVAHRLLPRMRAKPQCFTGLEEPSCMRCCRYRRALHLVLSPGAAACEYLAGRRHGHKHATAERRSAACCNIGMHTACACAQRWGKIYAMMCLPNLKALAHRCLHAHGAAPCQTPCAHRQVAASPEPPGRGGQRLGDGPPLPARQSDLVGLQQDHQLRQAERRALRLRRQRLQVLHACAAEHSAARS
jgi:hypothetical protein